MAREAGRSQFEAEARCVLARLVEHVGDFRPASLEIFLRVGSENHFGNDGLANYYSGFLNGAAAALEVSVTDLLRTLDGTVDARSPDEERRLEAYLVGYREARRWWRDRGPGDRRHCLAAVYSEELPHEEAARLRDLVVRGELHEGTETAFRTGFRDALILPLGG